MSTQSLFQSLRKKYPRFVYRDFSAIVLDDELIVHYHYEIDPDIRFTSKISINIPEGFKQDDVQGYLTHIYSLGLIDALSYWKCTCSPTFEVPFGLSEEQIKWWKKLFYLGLGEFRYQNKIDITAEDFVDFHSSQSAYLPKADKKNHTGQIIPIGGGKDSIVTLKSLEEFKETNSPFLLNARGASSQTIAQAGYTDEQTLYSARIIDPALIQLNEDGLLNGHTPFSALLAFVTILLAEVHQKKYVVLSNEASAEEGNVKGRTDVNHQYSKSFEFEKDFDNYVTHFITDNVLYFSALRHLSEIQIAALFSKHDDFHKLFRSCNVGIKKNSWCCKCSKCLFVAIILAPFIPPSSIDEIFPENPLRDLELIDLLHDLIGDNDSKPFECVGTYEEILASIKATKDRWGSDAYSLFQDLDLAITQDETNHQGFIERFSDNHNIPQEFFSVLKKKLNEF